MTERKPDRLIVRCTKGELRFWRRAARADGRSLSSWVRRMLNVQAQVELVTAEAFGDERREQRHVDAE